MRRRLWSKTLVRSAPLFVIGGAGGSLFFIALALVTIFTSTLFPQGFEGVRSNIADGVSPILGAVSRPVQDAALFIRNVTGLAEMQAENLRLQKENERLREWYQSAMVLDAENQSLRELMHVKIEPQDRYVTARILSDSGYSFVKSLLVQAGKSDGVEKGQAVISGNGLIGRIVEAGDKTSRVLLVTDINSRVPVLVENSRQHAIMAGQNDELPHIIHLPPGSQLQAGDRIMTSGQGGIFPHGLAVGRVVLDKDGTPRVELFADFSRMIYVRVIDRPVDPNLRTGSLN